jgi:uncharacterized Tic20 family protein
MRMPEPAYPPSPFDPAPGGDGRPGATQARPGRLVDQYATSDQRMFAMFEHLVYFCWIAWFPGVLVTLILWLIKKNDSPFIDDHGRESLNMQLSLILYGLLAVPLTAITCGTVAILWAVVPIAAAVFTVMGAIAAHRGEYYRYPAIIRFL